MEKGDKVQHVTYGSGVVKNVDRTTFAFPFVTVLITEGRYKGCSIVRAEPEWEKR